MARVIVRLSTFAKFAAGIAAIGGLVWSYGASQEVEWARDYGQAAMFGGAILYLIERMRMIIRARRVPKE